MRLIQLQIILFLLLANIANAQLKTGAEQLPTYLPLLKSKNVGVVANHTSYIDQTHLVDSLLSLKIKIKAIYSPEHGFKGNYADGASIKDGKYKGVPVISLYGKSKKPSNNQLKGIDLVVFDMQDVGVRFYTYISTLTYMMEACAENNIPVLLLDRPNPNGFYIDGPVLEPGYKSFVGLHPVPVVYAMTIGEYAKMVNGEGWLKNGVKCRLTVVKLKNYDRSKTVELKISPSPNLQTTESILLYPSLCFFEGTNVSVGRGTKHPFECVGFPGYKEGPYEFTPKSIPGVSDNPKHQNVKCSGYFLKPLVKNEILDKKQLNLLWLKQFYDAYPEKGEFFNSYFNLLAGTNKLAAQLKNGNSVVQIRQSWQPDIANFKTIRSKYLLYPDIEQ